MVVSWILFTIFLKESRIFSEIILLHDFVEYTIIICLVIQSKSIFPTRLSQKNRAGHPSAGSHTKLILSISSYMVDVRSTPLERIL